MMEEELLKCRTDCVYFLASPFTCKKGEECEYRHCEAARLNPRDCWYWLYGTCSNITCCFRHPPLDVHNEGSTEATDYVPHQPSVPATKTTVPCYFYYYNGLCGKGDMCPYLHEPANSFGWCQTVGNSVSDAIAPPAGNKASGRSDLVPKHAEKDPNPSDISTVTGNKTSGRIDIVPKHTGKHPSLSELATVAGNNTSVRSDTVPKHAEKYPSLSERVTITDKTLGRCESVHDKYPSLSKMVTISGSSSQVVQIQPAQKASIENVLDQYTPVRTYISECEETTDIEDSPRSECEPSLGSDQSSEELIHRSIVQDEWWESSPGFDVLVDEQTQGLPYEDDLEYIYPHIESEGEGDPLLAKYGFETNSNEGEFFNYGLYEPSELLDCELRANRQKNSHTHSQNRNIDSRKRKLCSLESPVDLRDHLRRKRMIDGHLVTHDLRHDLMQRRYDRTERSVRYRPNQHLYGGLASRVETNGMLDRRTSVTATNLRGRLRYSQKNDFRNYNGMRRRYPQQGLYLKRDKYAPQVTVVAKSRSLAKVEKGKRPGYYSKNESVNFEGPKPLSEILKEKKKTVSCEDDTLTGFC